MHRTSVRARVPHALAAAISLAFAASAHAAVLLPSGPSPVVGTPVFSTSGSTLTMNQSDASAVVDWASFSIGQGGSVVFNVPPSGTSVHNDNSGSVSQLDGTWTGSGNITLNNTVGIALGGAYQGTAGSLELNSSGAVTVAGTINTTGDLQINDNGFQSTGEIRANTVTINDGQSITQNDQATGGLFTNVLSGSAAGSATFANSNNQIGVVDGLSVGVSLRLTNNADIVLKNVNGGQTTFLDARGHDIIATDAGNAFAWINASGRNISMSSSTAMKVYGLFATGDATLASTSDIAFDSLAGASANVAGNLDVQSDGGSIFLDLPGRSAPFTVGGRVSLRSATGDIAFGGDSVTVGQYVTASGRNVTLTGESLHASDLTASGQVTLNGSTFGTVGVILTGAVNAPLVTVNGAAMIADGASLSGDLALNGVLSVNRTTDFTYGGTITSTSAGKIALVGSGTTTLNGSSAQAAPVDVTAGTLVVGDASHASARVGTVTVANGAALGGYGTIAGDLTLAAGSTLKVDASDTSASRLGVTGHATIGGSSLVINAQGTQWGAGKTYTILAASNGLTGTFASVETNLAFLNAQVTYASTGEVNLRLSPNSVNFVDVANTPNQRAVAMAATALGAGNPVYDGLVALDATSARAAFTSLAGDLHASAKGVVMDSQRQVRDAVVRHLADADLPGGNRADAGRVSTWVSVLGRDGDYDGNANAGKVDASGTGLLLGADLGVGDNGRIGVVLGHTRENVHERSVGGSADVRGNQVGIYGSVSLDALRLSGGVVQAHHSIDTRRSVVVGVDNGTAYASRDADTTQGFAELGYAFAQGQAFTAEPFVQAAVVRWNGDKATERGTAGALGVSSDDAHLTTGRAGVHLGQALGSDMRFGLQATLAWQRAWGDTTPSSRLHFAGGDTFTTTGAPLARNAGVVDAGIVARLSPNLRLDASYVGQFAGKASDHGGRIALNMAF